MKTFTVTLCSVLLATSCERSPEEWLGAPAARRELAAIQEAAMASDGAGLPVVRSRQPQGADAPAEDLDHVLFRLRIGRREAYDVDAVLSDPLLNTGRVGIDVAAREGLAAFLEERLTLLDRLQDVYSRVAREELRASGHTRRGAAPKAARDRLVQYAAGGGQWWVRLDDLPVSKEILEFKEFLQESTAMSVMEWLVASGLTSGAEAEVSRQIINLMPRD